MAYRDVTPMLEDEILQGRVRGCILEQASLKDLSTDQLAKFVMSEPDSATRNFMWFFGADEAIVAFYADPQGGGEANVTDQTILSKCQAVWDDVALVLHFDTGATSAAA